MREKKAKKLLNKVKNTYSHIADDFSATRVKHEKELGLILPYIKANTTILDVGCGNGRVYHFLSQKHLPEYNYIGFDNTKAFINICKKKYPSAVFLDGDILKLPCKNNFSDLTLYVRSLHHIPSEEYRRKAIAEAMRVAKPGGTLYISVWNLWQKKYIHNIIIGILRSLLTFGSYDYNDLFIKWGKNHKRYYHAFTIHELRNLATSSGFSIISQHIGNDLIILAKKA